MERTRHHNVEAPTNKVVLSLLGLFGEGVDVSLTVEICQDTRRIGVCLQEGNDQKGGYAQHTFEVSVDPTPPPEPVPDVPQDDTTPLPPKWERLLWFTFITACEGGVACWSTRRKYRHNSRDDDDDYTPTDYSAVISEDDSGEDKDPRHDINRAVMLKGFRIVLGDTCPLKDTHEQVQKIRAAWVDPEDEGDIDADGADILVQLALFGEIVY